MRVLIISGEKQGQNIAEKDIVLRVAEEMVLLNRTLFDDTWDVYLTRYQDTLISLSDRARFAKSLNGDIFISLHCNHSDNPKAKGIEVYVTKKKFKHSRTSTRLAYEFQRQLQDKLGYKSRGVKFASFQVLQETTDLLPSVLVELGFLSNEDESTYYHKPESFRAIALVLLESLIQNLENYEGVGD